MSKEEQLFDLCQQHFNKHNGDPAGKLHIYDIKKEDDLEVAKYRIDYNKEFTFESSKIAETNPDYNAGIKYEYDFFVYFDDPKASIDQAIKILS